MTYDHTQESPFYLIPLGSVVLLVGVGLLVRATPPVIAVLSGGAAIFVFLAYSFKHLRVRDEGDCLAIHFGPLPVFRRRIPYSQITGAEADRSSFWDGWGIH